jgi:tRNA A-37 threonylcarbamoyl transferase component Bud32
MITAQSSSPMTTHLPSHTAQDLRRAGRHIAPPFTLTIKALGSIQELVCHEILRNLPGKRLVCFGTWQDREEIVAKVYLDRRRGKTHFQRELHGIQALEAADIPTPSLLHSGTLADGRTPILLTRRIKQAIDLKKALVKNPPAAEMKEMLSTTVGAIASMHSAGLSQRDIHPGNFLLTQNTVMIIDGADIQQYRRKPLPQGASIADLGFFLSPFSTQYENLLTGLIRDYCHCREWSLTPQLIKRVEKAISRQNDRREKKFLQKTMRSSTAFIARRTWHRHMVCDRNWYSPTVQPLLDDPDTAMETGTILKAGNSATVVKIKVADRILVIKRYNLKNRSHAFSRALRPTRAIISWRNANRLKLMGIPTPQPLAFIEERLGPLRRRAFFISEYIPGESISEAIEKNKDTPKQLMHYANYLIHLLKHFYRLRISHGDLKSTNLVVYDDHLHVLDLDGMHKHLFLYFFKRAFRKDINRLIGNWQQNVTFSELLTKRIIEAFSDA